MPYMSKIDSVVVISGLLLGAAACGSQATTSLATSPTAVTATPSVLPTAVSSADSRAWAGAATAAVAAATTRRHTADFDTATPASGPTGSATNP